MFVPAGGGGESQSNDPVYPRSYDLKLIGIRVQHEYSFVFRSLLRKLMPHNFLSPLYRIVLKWNGYFSCPMIGISFCSRVPFIIPTQRKGM